MFRRLGCLSTFLIYCRYDHIRLVATSFNSFFWGCSKFQRGWSSSWSGKTLCRKPKIMKHLFLHPYLKAGQLGFPYDDGPLLPSMIKKVPPKKNGKVGRNMEEPSWTSHPGTTLLSFGGPLQKHRLWRYVTCQCVVTLSIFGLGAHHCRSLQILSRGSHSGWTRQTLTEYSYSTRNSLWMRNMGI